MYITKAELIEKIELIQADYFDISIEETTPPISYFLPDIRPGARHDTVRKVIDQGEIRIEIIAKLPM